MIQEGYTSIPMLVYESVECQAISPACGEITNVYVRVAGRFHLTPQQQCVLCRLYLACVQLLHSDVLYLSDKYDNTPTTFLYTPHNKISSYHHWNVNLLLEKWAVFLLTTVLWGIGYWPTKKLPILITEGSAWSWSRPQVVTRQYIAITFCQACGYLPSRRASPPLASSKLYWLVPEAHKCKQLAQCCYAAFARSRIWTHDQMLIASPTLYPLHHRATHKDNTK